MSDLDALTPIEQKTIVFNDDQLTAVLVDVDGRQVVYVPLRSICDYLGVDWSGQRQRILRDAVLSNVVSGVVVTTTPLDNRYANPQEMLCIPLDHLNGFLFGINANRVKVEIRERLIRYQKECYRVLADTFLETRVADGDWMTTSSETRAALERIREMGLAIARQAEEQMAFEMRSITDKNL
jgi:hypothetical protein